MTRWLNDVRADVNAATARHASLTEDLQTLRDRATATGRELTPGEQQRVERLTRGIERAADELAALQDEGAGMLSQIAANPNTLEPIDEPSYNGSSVERLAGRYASASVSESRALRAVERHKDVLTPAAGDRLDEVIRKRDPQGLGAAYIAAVAEPAYSRAFGKLLQHGTMAHLHMSREEQAAIQAVVHADEARAMSLTGSAGGFGVPFELDPSILASSNGAINPIRQLATVTTIAVDEWRGVSSLGITAAFAAEATEVGDNAPTLVQPTISTEKAQAFVPFSIEVGMDYVGLQTELGRLLADTKDVLEATAFLTGTGTNEPGGILNIGGTGGLTTTQRVLTDVVATLDIDDVWDLKGNLTNTRFAVGATIAGNSAMIDRIFRFTPSGSTTEPQAMPDRGGPLMGYPVAEWSTMVNTTTTGSKVLILADWKACYRIIDRIGLSVELIPHLFATANNRPSGQRGLYAFWRTGGGVQVANAARYLEVA